MSPEVDAPSYSCSRFARLRGPVVLPARSNAVLPPCAVANLDLDLVVVVIVVVLVALAALVVVVVVVLLVV